MTTPPPDMVQGPPPSPQPAAAAPEKQKNTPGLIAIIAAIIGFIFACIPGALIVGWTLLPVAFILGIVAVCLSGKRKGTGIAAIIVSVVGTIVGFVVFFAIVGDAVNDAVNESFGSGEVTVSGPEDGAQARPASDSGDGDTGDTRMGTRQHPYPIGSTVSDGDWDVTVNGVTLDADQAVASANPYLNDPADPGHQYLMANVTAAYNGNDPQGKMPSVLIGYVTANGNTVHSWDGMVIAPDQFPSTQTLYGGASVSGNFVFEVPASSAADGTLAVQATPLSDKVFVAVR